MWGAFGFLAITQVLQDNTFLGWLFAAISFAALLVALYKGN